MVNIWVDLLEIQALIPVSYTHLVVVITSGIPRKPGMTREQLIGTNAGIVKSVVDQVLQYSPNAIFVIISNPMDTMTYLALKASGVPKNRIIGMGGMLDSSRFRYYLSQALGCTPTDVDGMVIGGHGDKTMIPLARFEMCIRDRWRALYLRIQNH